MIIKAIMSQVATGSIKNVITRGMLETYPEPPYVIVYADFAIDAYYQKDNTIQPIMIEAHYPMGNSDLLDAYIENEIVTLLHRKRLTDSEGYTFQVYATMALGIIQEPNDDRSISGGNDDKTVSRTRRFFVPRRGR